MYSISKYPRYFNAKKGRKKTLANKKLNLGLRLASPNR